MPSEKVTQLLSQKALERKSSKPIMEKRRRARINNSLAELKNLILDTLKKDNTRHSKLEKADILEMTVKHLQNLHQQNAQNNHHQMNDHMMVDGEKLAKFRAGFNECANQVNNYIEQVSASTSLDPRLRQSLLSHLAHCLTNYESMTPSTVTSPLYPVNIEVPVPNAITASRTSISSPVWVLGSSGILSPASSDGSSCSSPPGNESRTTFKYSQIYEPISPVSVAPKYQFDNYEEFQHFPSRESRVWRPW